MYKTLNIYAKENQDVYEHAMKQYINIMTMLLLRQIHVLRCICVDKCAVEKLTGRIILLPIAVYANLKHSPLLPPSHPDACAVAGLQSYQSRWQASKFIEHVRSPP